MGALKTLAITGSAVLLLGAGAVVGDSLFRTAAEDHVAGQLQAELGLAQPPTVELGGVPFSAVLVTRKLPSASASAVDVPLEISGVQVSLDRVSAEGTGLVLGNGQVVVSRATGEAMLGYPALTSLAGVPVEAGDEPGRVQVSYTADLFGRELVAVVSAVPALEESGDRLDLTGPEISIAGIELGPDVADRIISLLVKPIKFELPYGLMPQAISADSAGLTLELAADNLVVPLG